MSSNEESPFPQHGLVPPGDEENSNGMADLVNPNSLSHSSAALSLPVMLAANILHHRHNPSSTM